MSRCRHRDRRGYSLVDFYLRDGTLAGPFDGHRLFRGVCPRCGTISLGPANDTPETAVEVEAARIASIGTLPPTRTDDENEGWEAHEWGEPTPGGHAAQAGWLARDIVVELMKEPDRD